MHRYAGRWLVCLTLVFFAACESTDKQQAQQEGHQQNQPFAFTERVVAGGPSDFMEVRHLVLRGSNFEIGKKLAELAYSRYKSCAIPYPNHENTRAQRQYFERNYPVHLERMRGVAAHFGKDLSDDAWNFAGLYYGLSSKGSGCSVVFYPPNTTEQGQGVLSRNFDFSTGTFFGAEPEEGQLAACARPYVIELYPDQGYASLVTCCFDLLGGACDGINSEGLTVALLSDNDVIEEYGLYPASGPQEGFNEIQIVRYLLDSCADAEEAKEALRQAKLYYNMAPNHYIIADRHARSFIWENSPETGRGHIVEGDDRPLVTTNFLRHRYPDPEGFPVEEHPLGLFNRYREIQRRIAERADKFDDNFIKETNRCVAFEYTPLSGEAAPNRTLWHALYHPEQRTVEIDFYLGDEVDPTDPNDVKIRRSGYKTFTVEH
jgi:hypothetical protein